MSNPNPIAAIIKINQWVSVRRCGAGLAVDVDTPSLRLILSFCGRPRAGAAAPVPARGRRLNDGLSNSLHAAGTLFRGDDLQHFDGRALVAVDDARAPVGDARLVEIKPRHHHWAGNHSEVSRRLDAAQDLVVYENPAQWRLPEQDFL